MDFLRVHKQSQIFCLEALIFIGLLLSSSGSPGPQGILALRVSWLSGYPGPQGIQALRVSWPEVSGYIQLAMTVQTYNNNNKRLNSGFVKVLSLSFSQFYVLNICLSIC